MISYLKHDFPLEKITPINSMYLGISYTDNEVEKFSQTLDKKYSVTKYENDDASMSAVAKLLANYEVVAVMRGQGEW